MRRDTPRYHQATPMGHSFSKKSKWTSLRDSNWAFSPREPGSPPGRACQHGSRVTRVPGHSLHYPTHETWNHQEDKETLAETHKHLGRFPDKGSFPQVSSQDAPGEMCQETPPGAQQLWREKSSPHVLHVSSAKTASASSLKHFSSFSPGLVPALVSTHSDSSLRASPTPQPLFPLDSLPPICFLSFPPYHPDTGTCLPPQHH
ncbi:hypothetical protein Celaphus_00017184 [Cervus elaphus hippelaphus]|uniref:Uncharacterized protein n=1 Tax=Cervus elaphus hippelaphus TaxID=46360 RepID=A0A212CN07_CEREH|nr:hypothetical protein Celaphus_00017184 [Cervus elaphus hippelaphus]